MIYVIMNSDVGRNQHGRSWQAKAALFAVSAMFAGVAAGASLGAVGQWLPLGARHDLALALAMVAVVMGALEASGRRMVVQRDCEVPQRVMHRGALRGSMHYGVSLGVGAMSRIGFAMWYVVPVAAVLTGNPLYGAIVYGIYSATRGFAPVIILGLTRVRRLRPTGRRGVSLWLLRQQGNVQRLAGAQLAATGILVFVLLTS